MHGQCVHKMSRDGLLLFAWCVLRHDCPYVKQYSAIRISVWHGALWKGIKGCCSWPQWQILSFGGELVEGLNYNHKLISCNKKLITERLLVVLHCMRLASFSLLQLSSVATPQDGVMKWIECSLELWIMYQHIIQIYQAHFFRNALKNSLY